MKHSPFLLLAMFISTAQAEVFSPVTSIGGGTLFVTNLAATQNFPIQNPAEDEFYRYQTQSTSRTAGFFDLFLGVEQLVSTEYRLQYGINYHQPSVLKVRGFFTQGLDAQSANTYSFQYYTTPHQLLAEAKLLYQLKAHVYPYVFGGIGASINTTNQYTTNVPPFLTYTRAYQNNTLSSFSYTVGAGVDWEIKPLWRVGAAWRWNDFGTTKSGASNIHQIPVQGTLSLSNVYANELLLQLSKVW